MALTPEKVRAYVKDDEYANALLEGELQSDDTLIELAMEMAISDFNSMAPVTAFTVDNFPSLSILLRGTLYHLAMGESERQLRNQISFSAQGLTSEVDNKADQYQRLAGHYWQLFQSQAQPFKVQANIQAAWGTALSPYSLLTETEYRS